MIRLRNIYDGRSALIIFGGPSLIENKFPFTDIEQDKYIVFLEAKSLTPSFLVSGIKPDYFLMFYPEKCKSNSFQHVIFQSFLADIDLSGLIKDELLEEYYYIRDNFSRFFEPWRAHRGLHKKYRYKDGVYFRSSPYDLLGKLSSMKLITCASMLDEYERKFCYENAVYLFGFNPVEKKFNLQDYFNPQEVDGMVKLKDYSFVNSSAVALYPLLNYMGFKQVYFLGMDMSMLGSMEYASCFTFRSMRHFGKFFVKARVVFNAAFKENRIKYMRPPYEFENLRNILTYDKIDFINIFKPFDYALPVNGIRNISYREFLNKQDSE